MKLPTIKQLEAAKEKGNIYTHVQELHVDTETPVSLFAKLTQNEPGSMLLESISGPKERSRYSFLLLKPVHKVTSLEDIQENLEKLTPTQPEVESIFAGGYVGFYPYDSVSDLEPRVPKKGSQIPVFFLHKQVLIFDHYKAQIQLLENFFLDQPLEPQIKEAQAFTEEVQKSLKSPSELPRIHFENSEKASDKTHQNQAPKSNMSKEAFLQKVAIAKEAIENGEVFQLVLSQRFEATYTEDPFTLYRSLRSVNPSPYMFYVQLGNRTIVGASPESLVRMQHGRLTLNPIAGTYPRGKTRLEDEELAEALKADPKEIAEHRMLVDLGRNDLGRLCEFGSIQVDQLMQVRRYSHVMHLVSEISGNVRAQASAAEPLNTVRLRTAEADNHASDLQYPTAIDVIKKCFPAGTLSGAPKVRAMELIAKLEDDPRGFYGGGFGYFDFYGNMDFAIVIRTFELANETVTLQTGAGLVHDSIPEKEYEETQHKAAANFRALNATCEPREL
jgi:anthranilate synthase component 1